MPSDIFAALRAWSHSLQTLIREGSAPTASSERAARRAAPARALQHASRSAASDRSPRHPSPPSSGFTAPGGASA